MNALLTAVAVVLILCGIISLLLIPLSWRRRYYFGTFTCLLAGLVMLLSAALIMLVSAGIKGYRALTREELAATVYITPLGSQQFKARIVRTGFPDTVFAVAGDEFYIDSRIIKWKPFINLLGVHTYYRLDRVTGRYRDDRDEATKVRTLYSLAGPARPWDLFFLAERFSFLSPLLDAGYGSASFVSAAQNQVLRVMVSTSGLLIRTEQP